MALLTKEQLAFHAEVRGIVRRVLARVLEEMEDMSSLLERSPLWRTLSESRDIGEATKSIMDEEVDRIVRELRS